MLVFWGNSNRFVGELFLVYCLEIMQNVNNSISYVVKWVVINYLWITWASDYFSFSQTSNHVSITLYEHKNVFYSSFSSYRTGIYFVCVVIQRKPQKFIVLI